MLGGESKSRSTEAASRSGWADAAQLMRDRGDDRLLDEQIRTSFDDEEWRWR
jgi:hypothetical protein